MLIKFKFNLYKTSINTYLAYMQISSNFLVINILSMQATLRSDIIKKSNCKHTFQEL